MSGYRKYNFAKKIYPNYIIYVYYKNKWHTFDKDLEIIKLLKVDNYNKLNDLKINNMFIKDGIIINNNFNKNNYKLYTNLIFIKKCNKLIMKKFENKL